MHAGLIVLLLIVNSHNALLYSGNATRFCRLDGTWMEANVTQCFAIALQVADTVRGRKGGK